MRATDVLQLLRIPVLLGLLLSSRPLVMQGTRAAVRVETEGVWQVWWWLVLLAMAFVVVALLGRRRPHRAAVLTLEGLIAAVLGLVPPVQWLMWFGINWFTEATGAVTGLIAPMQLLSIVWLGIVVMTGLAQARQTSPVERTPVDEGASR